MGDTPDYSQTPNQDNSADDQNFDVDVPKLASHWITPIDNIRSFAGINSQNTGRLKQLLQSGNFTYKQVAKIVKMEQTPQESRCHAFYRWIGFPVCDADKKIYNPGFDNIKDPSRTINFATKTNIAKKPIDGFESLSLLRETEIHTYLAIFSNPTSVDAGVLALSSGGNANLRKFVVPLEQSADPFDMTVASQAYQVDFTGLVGDTPINFKDYQDGNGLTQKLVKPTRHHFIKPFMVDARIDFAVQPHANLVAIPFVPDKLNTKVNSTSFVTRPLLEKIIRERFAVDDPTQDIGSASNKLIQFIASFPKLKDNDLIKLANEPNNILKRDEQLKLAQTINTIKSIMKKLVDAHKTVADAQKEHYWLPSPSTIGPEGGCSVQGVFFPTFIKNTLVTEKDANIFFSRTKDTLTRLTTSGITASGQPSPGDFGLTTNQVSFGPDTTDAMGDNNARNLKSVSSSRNRMLSDANTALQITEIIMGEFSGLGLCDIIAVVGALETIPKENLIGFLDVDAQARMLKAMNFTSVNGASYEEAMKALANRVKDFYNLMDQIYQDIWHKNGVPNS